MIEPRTKISKKANWKFDQKMTQQSATLVAITGFDRSNNDTTINHFRGNHGLIWYSQKKHKPKATSKQMQKQVQM